MNEPESRLPAARAMGLPTRIKSAWALAWRPVPVPVPAVDPELARLGFVPRSAEVIRYQVMRAEHALSPGGGLRCWLKLNVLLALGLAIPAILLVPPMTAVLVAFSAWAGYLAAATLSLLLALIYIILIGALLSALLGMARSRAAYRR